MTASALDTYLAHLDAILVRAENLLHDLEATSEVVQ